MHQPGFFLQQQHFKQVAHGFGMADDVVAYGLLAVTRQHVARALENRQLRLGQAGIHMVQHAQRPGVVQQALQHRAFGRLTEFRVAGLDAGDGQQFGHHFFMFVRTLAQVHRGQMETKHLHGANQRMQPLDGECTAVVAQQGGLDGAQVGAKVLRFQVRVLRRHRMACCVASGQALERGCQPGVHAGQRTPVRLVLAVFIGIRRTFGQRPHFG